MLQIDKKSEMGIEQRKLIVTKVVAETFGTWSIIRRMKEEMEAGLTEVKLTDIFDYCVGDKLSTDDINEEVVREYLYETFRTGNGFNRDEKSERTFNILLSNLKRNMKECPLTKYLK